MRGWPGRLHCYFVSALHGVSTAVCAGLISPRSSHLPPLRLGDRDVVTGSAGVNRHRSELERDGNQPLSPKASGVLFESGVDA